MEKKGLIGLIIMIVIAILVIAGIFYFIALKDKFLGFWGLDDDSEEQEIGPENGISGEDSEEESDFGAEEIADAGNSFEQENPLELLEESQN